MTNLNLQIRPDAVAVLTLDQPGSKANVLTQEMWTDLEAAVDSLAPRTAVRGLVIASAKPDIFIAGADLKLLANAPGPNDPAVRAFIDHGLRVLQKLESLPFPTCAAIDGAALGGGLEVALACDTRMGGGSPKLQLGLPEVKLGLIPGWGGTQRLPRLIHRRTNFFDKLARAADVISTGKSLGVSDAVSLGLLDAVVDSESLIEHAARTAAQLDRVERRALDLGALPAPPFSLTIPEGPIANCDVIRVITRGASLPLYEGIKLETEAFMQLAGSDESKRLIAKFFASRKK